VCSLSLLISWNSPLGKEDSSQDAHYLTEEKGTQEIGVYSFQYNKTIKVHLIDTPGFDDTNRSDFHVLEEIASFLSRSYKDNMVINGIIYLHRISDVRMQGSSMTSIQMFRKLVGTDFYPHVVLATTMWELVDHDVGVKRETELISDSKFWGYMKGGGCRFGRVMNTKASAMDIVGMIVGQQSGDSLSKDNNILAVQRELVDQGKDLIDTNVGREIQSQFSETIKRQGDELAAVKEELRLAQQTQRPQARHMLMEQREIISQELKRMTQIQENMRQEMQTELERREKRHQAEIEKLMRMNERIRADIVAAEKMAGAERITAQMTPTSSMALLGHSLYNEGRYTDAEKEFRKAAKEQETTLGPMHEDTLDSIYWLGHSLYKKGRYTDAEKEFRKALKGQETTLGPMHKDTLDSIQWLGHSLRKQERYTNAEKAYQKAAKRRETTLGPMHEDTLDSIYWLGHSIYKNGRYTDAEKEFRKAAEGREITLGPIHEDTLHCIQWLGHSLYKKERYTDAEKEFRKAAEGRETTRGSIHKDTLDSIHWVGLSLYNQGEDFDAAREFFKALKGRKATLGPMHKDTLDSDYWFGRSI
jgi:TolA-binding protein